MDEIPNHGIGFDDDEWHEDNNGIGFPMDAGLDDADLADIANGSDEEWKGPVVKKEKKPRFSGYHLFMKEHRVVDQVCQDCQHTSI